MRFFVGLVTAGLCVSLANAQTIVFAAPGTATENFDTLASVASTTNAFTNGTTINGLYAFRQLASPAAETNYRSDSGGSNAGAVYSWGVAGTNALTERAFGSVSSGTPGTFAYGFLIQNTSGASLDISLAYTGEQWRNGGNVTAQKIAVSYKTVTGAAPTTAADWDPAGGILPTGYTAAPALDFTGPIATATLAALDGNAAANRQVFSNQAITTVAAGDYLIVRWADLNDAGNDHGLSLDDVTFTASPVPEPTSILAMCGFAGFVGNVIRRRRAAKKAAV